MKEKLVNLLILCLNKEQFYKKETTHHRLDEVKQELIKFRRYIDWNQDLFVTCTQEDWGNSFHDKLTIRERNKYYKLFLPSEYVKQTQEWREMFNHFLTIEFEDMPSLNMHLSYKRNRVKIEKKLEFIERRFLFFKYKVKANEHVTTIVNKDTYEYYYIIEHGKISAELTLEEGLKFIELYKTNRDKFESDDSIKKLDERLEKYK